MERTCQLLWATETSQSCCLRSMRRLLPVDMLIPTMKNLGSMLDDFFVQERAFGEFSEKARRIRNNDCDPEDFRSIFRIPFDLFARQAAVSPPVTIRLPHGLLAKLRRISPCPRAGKTTIVYGAFSYLNNLPRDSVKHVDALVVVGPLSSFQPWEDEFFSCFQRKPTVTRLDGSQGLSEKKDYLIAGDYSDFDIGQLRIACLS